MGKLVRDLIPDIMRAEGLEPDTRTLGQDEYLQGLLEKFTEEARELQTATPANRLEEAADVFEVLTTLVNEIGHTMQDVQMRADEKRTQRGGFDGRIWLQGR